MGRRRFDHLFVELCLAAGAHLSRWALWLRLHELGWDPESLSRDAALRFCQGPAEHFLAERGLRLTFRSARQLRRSVRRYDPSVAPPEELLA